MHWMSVKSADNFQIREHSWTRLFHIILFQKIAKLPRYTLGTGIRAFGDFES
jgi:hypothetical protein